jgi:hypothetical protein
MLSGLFSSKLRWKSLNISRENRIQTIRSRICLLSGFPSDSLLTVENLRVACEHINHLEPRHRIRLLSAALHLRFVPRHPRFPIFRYSS